MANMKRYAEAQKGAINPPPRCPEDNGYVHFEWEDVTVFGDRERMFTPIPQWCMEPECNLRTPTMGVDWGQEWKSVMEE